MQNSGLKLDHCGWQWALAGQRLGWPGGREQSGSQGPPGPRLPAGGEGLGVRRSALPAPWF